LAESRQAQGQLRHELEEAHKQLQVLKDKYVADPIQVGSAD
jgi:hypothetical protein